jgi:3',5'-cyclic AMP phosphodiesterase CpdA
MRSLACVVAALSSVAVIAQAPASAPLPSEGATARQAPAAQQAPTVSTVAVRPIPPPATPLPDEQTSAGVTRFSFIAYGDTRSAGEPGVPGDGQILHPQHSKLVDGMLEKVKELASTPFPIRFVVQSGDAVLRGANGAMWNISFTPTIERLTLVGDLPYFFAVGNHDVTTMPLGNPGRQAGLQNTSAAMSNLWPPEGSPRRLRGYPTFAFGYGNTFVVELDSNIAADETQLSWVRDQLEHLDRTRYRHVVAVFHHPIMSSGPHGGATVEPQTIALRTLYMPLFRRHHVRLIIAGHDHLLDHWVERYVDPADGKSYRLDQIITGGGGAPIYAYSSEPDLTTYLSAGAAQRLRIEHLMKPGPTRTDNPHHFIIVRVDGDHLSLEVMAIGGAEYKPYKGRAHIDLD